jgi:hypothetical protein
VEESTRLVLCAGRNSVLRHVYNLMLIDSRVANLESLVRREITYHIVPVPLPHRGYFRTSAWQTPPLPVRLPSPEPLLAPKSCFQNGSVLRFLPFAKFSAKLVPPRWAVCREVHFLIQNGLLPWAAAINPIASAATPVTAIVQIIIRLSDGSFLRGGAAPLCPLAALC